MRSANLLHPNLFTAPEHRLIEQARKGRARDAKDDRIRREIERVEAAVRALRATLDEEMEGDACDVCRTDHNETQP